MTMPSPEYPGKFYLGRIFDQTTGATTAEPYLYDPADLTTHAVVVGMTGSGKTGLCLDMMEEAALNGIPAILIDPKGDIANLLLQFPNLAPQDFQPWVDPDAARRQGKTVEQAAAEAAALWKTGLAGWGIEPDRIRRLKEAAELAVYTPGSEAGLPISILSSFAAPDLTWTENQEILREKIAATVNALLGLIGLGDLDPLVSREHILLANLFERAWSQGRDLDLPELILQTQNPPFDRLGVFEVEQFFPQKDRFALAMRLNNMLASPAFQVWMRGAPLDIKTLLYAPDGKPRHTIFYIAHLADAERMFIVTLLFSAVEAWMRTQAGSTGLRALIYFDEIFGYLPPVSAPPSKTPMLRMLKQARAFGVGLVLATQNPVDLDYKALSNTGTWFVGKLQTEQDKNRLLDGLEGVTGAAAGFDRATADKLISSLGKRVFLVNNVHARSLTVFQTRWAICYLAGPLTRAQLGAVNELAGASSQAFVAPSLPTIGGDDSPAPDAPAGRLRWDAGVSRPSAAPPVTRLPPTEGHWPPSGLSQTRPAVPSGLAEYFLPNNLTISEALHAAGPSPGADALSPSGGEASAGQRTPGVEALPGRLIYKPGLLAQADARFLDRKNGVDEDRKFAAFVPDPDRRGVVRWENFPIAPVDSTALPASPEAGAIFGELDPLLTDLKKTAALQKDFLDFVYRTAALTVLSNPTLKLTASPGDTPVQFKQQCADAARAGRDAEAAKLGAAYRKKIDALKSKLSKEERELAEDEAELKARKLEELAKHGETLLSLFGGRRGRSGISTSLSKRRMTGQAKDAVKESVQSIEDFKVQLAQLEEEMGEALEALNDEWAGVVDDVQEIRITPLKKDIVIDLFGVAWQPVWLAEAGGRTVELPAYG